MIILPYILQTTSTRILHKHRVLMATKVSKKATQRVSTALGYHTKPPTMETNGTLQATHARRSANQDETILSTWLSKSIQMQSMVTFEKCLKIIPLGVSPACTFQRILPIGKVAETACGRPRR